MTHEMGLIRSTIKEIHKLGYRTNREIVFYRLKMHSGPRYLDENEEAALLVKLDSGTVRNGVKSIEAQKAVFLAALC